MTSHFSGMARLKISGGSGTWAERMYIQYSKVDDQGRSSGTGPLLH
jgi:hypothetical protein